MCHLYFPILDKFLTELMNTLDDKNVIVMKGVASCTPSSSIFLSLSELTELAEVYDIEKRSCHVKFELPLKTFQWNILIINTVDKFGPT